MVSKKATFTMVSMMIPRYLPELKIAGMAVHTAIFWVDSFIVRSDLLSFCYCRTQVLQEWYLDLIQ